MKSRIFVIALALVFVTGLAFAASPNGKMNGKENGNNWWGDVCQYEFGTTNTDGGNLNLCWDIVEGECVEADKYSVELYGLVSYAYGTVEPYTWVFNEDYSYDYGTFDRCFSMSLSDIADDIAADLPADLLSFSFGTIEAKVKGLDPTKSPKKRQNNVFNELEDHYSFGSLNWTPPAPE